MLTQETKRRVPTGLGDDRIKEAAGRNSAHVVTLWPSVAVRSMRGDDQELELMDRQEGKQHYSQSNLNAK